MSLPISSDVYVAMADKFMDALAMVPESKRAFAIWSGEFEEKGEKKTVAAMSPEKLGADVVSAMGFFLRASTGRYKLGSEEVKAHFAASEQLEKKPLAELAELGRQRAREVAKEIDALRPDQIVGNMEGASRPMTGAQFIAVEFAHLIHHRAQMYWLLRAMGMKPPAFM